MVYYMCVWDTPVAESWGAHRARGVAPCRGRRWNMDLSTQQNRVPFSIDIWKLDLSSFRDARASGVVNGKKNTGHSAPGRRLALATVVLVE